MIINNVHKKPTFPVLTITFEEAKKPGGPFQVSMKDRGGTLLSHAFSLKSDAVELLENDPEEYGKVLGKALFSYKVLGVDYQEVITRADENQERVHIRLEIGPGTLQQLHWERIFHRRNKRWVPLGSTAATPLSRLVPLTSIVPAHIVHERPLRMLVLISSPSDLDQRYHLDPISLDERQALHQCLDALGSKMVDITYLESGTAEGPTLDNFRRVAPRNFHLLHFLCHGAETEAGTVLYMEKPDGKTDPVRSNRLIDAMEVLDPRPLFCFLAACESASREAHDAFLPLGPALVQEGCVQAAVAMSGKVGIDTARTFACQFYEQLLYHGLVDLAVTEARSLVQERWDWGVPVLFSRLENNQLIDFPQTSFYEHSLAYNDRAYQPVRLAKDAAMEHVQDVGMQAIHDIDALIGELNKSHSFVNQTASAFRELGYDQKTLAKKFPEYYPRFMETYGGQTWIHEKTSCRTIKEYADKIMLEVGSYLDDQDLEQLRLALSELGQSDDDMIGVFQGFMEQMSSAVEQIHKQLLQKDRAAALQTKLAFEAQIAPAMRRSIEMFDKMEDSLNLVQAS